MLSPAVRVVGPLRGVAPDGVRAALAGLHTLDPRHPLLGGAPDGDALARRLRTAVRAAPGAGPAELAHLLLAPGAARVLVGDAHVATRLAAPEPMLRELLLAAAQRRAARPLPVPPPRGCRPAVRPAPPDPRPLRDWHPRPATATAVAGPGAAAPGTGAAALTVRVARALRAVGLPPHGVGAVVDGRRLPAADLTDPAAVAAALRRARPARPDPAVVPPSVVAAEPQPRLTLRRADHGLLADLPWAAGPRADVTAAGHCPPEGVVVAATTLGGELHLTATFHATTFPAELVAAALRLAAGQPAPGRG
ncbi:hypothetical protein [Spirilliplanes yamanashiensis]|uniref:hypothetical protein n=1 Tax=Spirilliplanes yamanashiensis TaxID=42233 RepID=UPI00194E3706|nr:hypothetical protein [Spirilliplanes yamanashiensis]MDP9817512.1 hypothetical protein [Spirilliplanes yamanashiensis]